MNKLTGNTNQGFLRKSSSYSTRKSFFISRIFLWITKKFLQFKNDCCENTKRNSAWTYSNKNLFSKFIPLLDISICCTIKYFFEVRFDIKFHNLFVAQILGYVFISIRVSFNISTTVWIVGNMCSIEQSRYLDNNLKLLERQSTRYLNSQLGSFHADITKFSVL